MTLRTLPMLLLLMLVARAQEHTNVVFLLVDDLGFMDVGANNPDAFYETPNIDRLAATGMRFTNGYAASPVCSPTRYSIMTGRYPSRVDATDFFTGRRAGRFLPAELNDRMPLAEVTIAEALQSAGYATFFAGKWHLGPDAEHWPENQGFDVNKGGWSRGGPYGGDKYFSPYGNPRLDDGPPGEHLPDRLASETIRFMAEHADEPFFAFLAFYSVHTPLMSPQDLVEKYTARAAEIEGEEFGPEEQVWPVVAPRRVRLVQKHATYAAMVESVDRAIGRVLESLDELGLADDTVVFLMSDNGGLSTSEGSPTSNLPLRGGKGWLYEGGIREPLIIRWPGVTEPGSTSDEPVISTDFHPTILELAGLPAMPEQHLDGVSLARSCAGPARPSEGTSSGTTRTTPTRAASPARRSARATGSSSSASRTGACTCTTWRATRASRRTSRPSTPNGSAPCASACTPGTRKWTRSSCVRRRAARSPGVPTD